MTPCTFIVFTGIDGSGKSTQAQLLVKELQKHGYPARYVWARWEPLLLKPASMAARWVSTARLALQGVPRGEEGGHRSLKETKGKVFRSAAMRKVWLFLAVADYWLQVKRKIAVPLSLGETVVTDRYLFDFLADLAVNFGARGSELHALCANRLFRGFPLPQASFHVAIPASVGYERKSDGTPLRYLQERMEVYDALATYYGMTRLDGTLPVAVIARQVQERVTGGCGGA